MKYEGVTVIHRIKVVIPNYRHPLEIVPIGDVHRHSPACALDLWHRDLDDMRKKHTPYTFYVGLGDFDDFMSGSERERTSDLHDSTLHQFDTICDMYVNKIAKELAFTKGQWLGMVEGNHRWEYKDGTSTTHKLCRALGAKWLGNVGYIRCSIQTDTARISVDVVTAHGKAGGKLAGTSINQVGDLRAIFPEADIYIMGHNHDRGGWPVTSLRVTQAKAAATPMLIHKEQYLCRSGSYLRGYIPGKSSYVASALMRPTSLGYIRLQISPVRTGKNGKRSLVPQIRCQS